MIKLILFLLFNIGIGFITESASQSYATDKGVFLIKTGTNLNFEFREGTPLDIEIGGGYFLMDKFLIGADLGYYKAGPFSDFYARPFARYYPKTWLFLGGGANGKRIPEDNKEKIVFDAELGVPLFLNGYIALDFIGRHTFSEPGVFSLHFNFSVYY